MGIPIQLPTRVRVRANDSSSEGLAVDLCFEMHQKNAFHYIVFLNSHGAAEVTSEELLKTFDEERATFLMDYIDPRMGFTGTIAARALQPQDLESALKAFRLYRDRLTFREDYERQLMRAMRNSHVAGVASIELSVNE